MANKIKYPRTIHLPYSPGATSDDKKLSLLEWSRLQESLGGLLVVSEKLDGENTTLSRDYVHARSLDSGNHESRNWVKNLWGSIRYDIPQGIRIHGENLFAKHSIYYDLLPSFFIVFGVTEGETFLSVEDTAYIAESLGLVCSNFTLDIPTVSSYNTTGEIEGYVYRNKGSFKVSDFQNNVFKYVREGHVQEGSKHWATQKVNPNKLK